MTLDDVVRADDEKTVVVHEALDLAGCGCFAFLIVCVLCATLLALVFAGVIR